MLLCIVCCLDLRAPSLIASPPPSSSTMSSPSTDALHLHFLRAALDEARKCEPTPTAFCVGCVLTASLPDSEPVIIARGYSRELPGNTHAEANALTKARRLSAEELQELLPGAPEGLTTNDVLKRADAYTTMEPCSVRTSGLAPCADALIAAKMRRCIIGVGEPDDFVQCEGARKLSDAGIEVIWHKGLEQECLAVARTGHDRS
ncbi:diaminohydroxyphosphoribosylamino-pyrimidine deaminase [Fomitopsis betulina]|nr:diaminohydroxyphosphoribosylamino-pyrimidine deaminase [Fomitopsis betulina]KAI0736763.1 diaminohydroxyphosphoribosylamino-pyrimidine deaminase [Fomitopsis betulina]